MGVGKEVGLPWCEGLKRGVGSDCVMVRVSITVFAAIGGSIETTLDVSGVSCCGAGIYQFLAVYSKYLKVYLLSA